MGSKWHEEWKRRVARINQQYKLGPLVEPVPSTMYMVTKDLKPIALNLTYAEACKFRANVAHRQQLRQVEHPVVFDIALMEPK